MSIRKSCFATVVAMLVIAQSALPLVANAGKGSACPLKCCKTMCPLKVQGCAMRACGTSSSPTLPLFTRFAVVDEPAQLVIDHATIDYAIAATPHPSSGFRFDLEQPPRHSALV
jgi:hypothetical protein